MPAAASLVRVEAIEVTGDDRDGDRQRQHPGDGTRGADQPPRRPDGHLVAVADRRHGDDRPPERVGDAVHLRVVAAELGVVDGAGEDEQGDEESDEEEAETFQTRLERHRRRAHAHDTQRASGPTQRDSATATRSKSRQLVTGNGRQWTNELEELEVHTRGRGR